MKYRVNAPLHFNQLILLFLTSFLSIRSQFIILGIARAFHEKKSGKGFDIGDPFNVTKQPRISRYPLPIRFLSR